LEDKAIALEEILDDFENAGFDVDEEFAARDKKDILSKVLTKAFLPPPYRPIRSVHPHLALCVTSEQIWEPVGYTRGELINSISLAPGEQLTLEVHSWDKSTSKTEEDLAEEAELRTAEKLTQRDALTITQEVAKQFGASLSASGTVNIKGVPVSLSGATSGQVNTNVRNTLERTRERTSEASNTLRTTRKMKIEISREVGRENKQTRIIANTNKCHTLNCNYFEILSNYLVTTRFVSVTPCLLLSYPKVDVNSDWVLCYEDILKKVLLDKVFLAGFEGARILEAHEKFLQLKKEEAKAKGEVAAELEEPLKNSIESILDAYSSLKRSLRRIKNAKKSNTCKGAAIVGGSVGLAVCVFSKVGLGTLRKLLYFAMLHANKNALNALKKLSDDHSKGINAGEALKDFYASISHRDFQANLTDATLAKGLDDMGAPKNVVNMLIYRGYIDWVYDDAGLYNAVVAGQKKLEDIWELPPESTDGAAREGFSTMEIAKAQVSFEQLKCHLNKNLIHYLQAIWSQEHPDQRLMRLQSYGALANILRNELVGFYGNKCAYPIVNHQEATNIGVNFEEILTKVKEEFANHNLEPQLVTQPTLGTVLEAAIGKCEACDDYINESRMIDLRLQKAKAEQEEKEAERRSKKLEAGDLSPNLIVADGKVVINVDGATPPT
jgi:hypothetical protein